MAILPPTIIKVWVTLAVTLKSPRGLNYLRLKYGKTAVWSIPFLIIVFTALKGSQIWFLFVVIRTCINIHDNKTMKNQAHCRFNAISS